MISVLSIFRCWFLIWINYYRFSISSWKRSLMNKYILPKMTAKRHILWRNFLWCLWASSIFNLVGFIGLTCSHRVITVSELILIFYHHFLLVAEVFAALCLVIRAIVLVYAFQFGWIRLLQAHILRWYIIFDKVHTWVYALSSDSDFLRTVLHLAVVWLPQQMIAPVLSKYHGDRIIIIYSLWLFSALVSLIICSFERLRTLFVTCRLVQRC